MQITVQGLSCKYIKQMVGCLLKHTIIRFLVEGSKGAILHTGDFRAEPVFINAIMKNPFLQQYLAPQYSASTSGRQYWSKTLDSIFLDTSSMLRMCNVPTKVGIPSLLS